MLSRRAAARKRETRAPAVSNSHYVGYVEDGESVEAIMKKFEELERIQEKFKEKELVKEKENQSPAPDASNSTTSSQSIKNGSASDITVTETTIQEGPSEQMLEEIFRQTSGFTVKSAQLMDNLDEDVDVEGVWKLLEDADTAEYEEEDDYVFAEDDDDFWDAEFGVARKKGRRLPASERGERKPRGTIDRAALLKKYRVLQVRQQDQNGNFVLVKKKICTVNPSLPTYVRIPPDPISRSWAHTILPWAPPLEKNSPGSRYREGNPLKFTGKELGNKYQCVYMDPPILLAGEEPTPGKLTMADMKKLDINSFMPESGFLFVWTHKEHLQDWVVTAEKNWSMRYVENFCWIQKNVNNKIIRDKSRHFNISKTTLLIFRKEGDIDIRHQRSPDCVFDFARPWKEGALTGGKPEFMYQVIETLLPQAVWSADNSEGERLLELWSEKDAVRRGWTSVAWEGE